MRRFGLASCALTLAAVGCAGRAELARGRELHALGQYREAYRSYWDAYQLHPSEDYRRELLATGWMVARGELAAGLAAERRGDLAAARDRFALAIEYAPDAPSLREDFARVWLQMVRNDELAQRLRAERQRPDGTWTELELVGELLRQPGQSLVDESALRAAFARGAARAMAALRAATVETPLPATREELGALEEAWGRLGIEVARLVEAEDLRSQGDDPLEREVAQLGHVRSLAAGVAAEVEEGRQTIVGALRGADLFEAGTALEARGELEAALDAYQAALAAHPFHEEARERCRRILRELCEDSWQRAQVAARARSWSEAIAAAETLLRHEPQHEAARQLREAAREELSSAHEAAARRWEQAGLPGNALARYRLACEVQPRRQDLRDAARRLERMLSGRLRPRYRVQGLASDPDQLRLRSALWGIPPEAIARSLEDVARRLQVALDEEDLAAASRPRAEERVEQTLWLEDFDFSCVEDHVSHGTEHARFVAGVEWIVDESREPLRALAMTAAEEARRAAARALSPPGQKGSYRAEQARLREQLATQADLLVASLPLRKPAVLWEAASFSTRQVHSRIELAARYRVAETSRWVAAVEERADRIVAGDPDRNIPPDAEERISRGEALRGLVVPVVARVASDLGDWRRERGERFHREALEQLGMGSFDVAVESLVAFLVLRKGVDDPLAQDANRRLRTVTGCDLLLAWKKEATTN